MFQAVFTHHQEQLTVFTASGSIHPSRCRLVSWMSSKLIHDEANGQVKHYFQSPYDIKLNESLAPRRLGEILYRGPLYLQGCFTPHFNAQNF
jgi:hypothetical protein